MFVEVGSAVAFRMVIKRETDGKARIWLLGTKYKDAYLYKYVEEEMFYTP